MKIKYKDFKHLISEAMGAFQLLDTLKAKINIVGSNRDIKIENLLTDIRVIEGIATVSQDGAVERISKGRRRLHVAITFDSKDKSQKEFIDNLANHIKGIKGVSSLTLKSLNDNLLIDDNGKLPVY